MANRQSLSGGTGTQIRCRLTETDPSHICTSYLRSVTLVTLMRKSMTTPSPHELEVPTHNQFPARIYFSARLDVFSH